MAAAGQRVLQVVRPHIPLIRFPSKLQAAPAGAAQPSTLSQQTMPEMPATLTTTSPTLTSASVPPPRPMGDTYSKPVGQTPRGSGIADKDLPLKYRRKNIDMEEIEYIERGGPV